MFQPVICILLSAEVFFVTDFDRDSIMAEFFCIIIDAAAAYARGTDIDTQKNRGFCEQLAHGINQGKATTSGAFQEGFLCSATTLV